jgi:hypothetical protein
MRMKSGGSNPFFVPADPLPFGRKGSAQGFDHHECIQQSHRTHAVIDRVLIKRLVLAKEAIEREGCNPGTPRVNATLSHRKNAKPLQEKSCIGQATALSDDSGYYRQTVRRHRLLQEQTGRTR